MEKRFFAALAFGLGLSKNGRSLPQPCLVGQSCGKDLMLI